jgi:hypothetical protein
MPPRRCNATRRAAHPHLDHRLTLGRQRSRNSAAAAFDFREAEAKLRWRQRGFGGVAPGPRPSPHRPRSMIRRSGSWRATPADPLAEHGIWGRPHQGAERHRRGKRRYPDGSNAGDVVKARGGDPGINRAASIAKKPRRSSKAWTFLSLARRMTVASSCVRPAVRASAKAASTVPENIAGVSRIHAPRAIAGAATPAATISSRRSAGNAAAGSHRPQTRRRRVRSHRSGGGKASIQPASDARGSYKQ